eukprot:Phypoly_transcript_13551.p1 GENE.Phypoly_transcript_13551~~Phypoly_transcript_13551.p1  ORF type:complete len:243 (+),score=6.44 Phypoly_transcript_13551:213-941(+)
MRAYKATDQNKDGFVNFREFHHLLDNLYYFNELGKAFAAADKDHDHRVSLTEFIAGHKVLGINEDDSHLKAEFEKIDTNHGGCIQQLSTQLDSSECKCEMVIISSLHSQIKIEKNPFTIHCEYILNISRKPFRKCKFISNKLRCYVRFIFTNMDVFLGLFGPSSWTSNGEEAVPYFPASVYWNMTTYMHKHLTKNTRKVGPRILSPFSQSNTINKKKRKKKRKKIDTTHFKHKSSQYRHFSF